MRWSGNRNGKNGNVSSRYRIGESKPAIEAEAVQSEAAEA